MNNSQTDQINKKRFSPSKLVNVRLFLLAVYAVFLTNSVIGQQETWRYVTTITEGVKFYLGADRQTTAGSNPLVWEKILRPNGASFVSFVEWDCRLKNRRAIQTTAYNADQTVTGMLKQPVWSPVIPDSASALLYRLICLPQPAEAFVEIIVPDAELRVAPNASAPIARTARRGEQFQLMTNTGAGGWYNVVERQSERDYWITGDCLQVIDAPPTTAAPKPKPAPPRTSSAAKTKPPVKTKPRKRH